MGSVLTAFHILVCLFLIVIVLLQQGRGADMGATFGGGGNTLFGASGADSFLIRLTAIVAAIFLSTALWLSIRTTDQVTAGGNLFANTSETPITTVDPSAFPGLEKSPEAGATASIVSSTVSSTVAPAPSAPVEAGPNEQSSSAPVMPAPAASSISSPAPAVQ